MFAKRHRLLRATCPNSKALSSSKVSSCPTESNGSHARQWCFRHCVAQEVRRRPCPQPDHVWPMAASPTLGLTARFSPVLLSYCIRSPSKGNRPPVTATQTVKQPSFSDPVGWNRPNPWLLSHRLRLAMLLLRRGEVELLSQEH